MINGSELAGAWTGTFLSALGSERGCAGAGRIPSTESRHNNRMHRVNFHAELPSSRFRESQDLHIPKDRRAVCKRWRPP